MEDDTYAREAPDGSIEIVNQDTGEVIEYRESFESICESRVSEGYAARLSYSPYLADIICERIGKGVSLAKICKSKGFPSVTTVARWTNLYPSFKAKLKTARRALALLCADAILDVAEIDLTTGNIGYISKDEAVGKKVQLDSLKWLAEKSDSEFFTTKNVKHFGDEDKPIKFIIETGIDRDSVVDARCEEVSDANTTESNEESGWERGALPAPQGESRRLCEDEEGQESSDQREGEHDNLQHEE